MDGSYDDAFVTDSTSVTVTTLSCCVRYMYSVSAFTIMYGPVAAGSSLLTLPDLSG